MNPLVSVIMPVFMVQDYVKKAILSIENQSYKNIELLCIDDASSDASFEICKRLASKYENIRLYKQLDKNGVEVNKNLGQEATRNMGLEKMTGKYCIFLDSDDTLLPDTIEEMVKSAEEKDVDMVLCGYSEVKNKLDIPRLAFISERKYSLKEFMSKALDEIPINIMSCIGNKLYRTKILNQNKIRFDSKYKYNEDLGFFLTVIENSNSIYYINKPFYKYLLRDHSSTMSSYKENMYDSIKKVYALLENVFFKYSCYEKKELLVNKCYFDLMVSSINNEAKFATWKKYKETAKKIREDDRFQKIFLHLEKSLSFQEKIYLFLLLQRRYRILYYIHKVKEMFIPNTWKDIRFDIISKYYTKLYRASSKDETTIYMFHNISDKITNTKYYVTNIQDFRDFMQAELKTRKAVSLDMIDETACGSSFSLTFDDGYQGVYQYAYPFLKDLSIPFTIFITVDYIGKEGYLSIEELQVLQKEPLCTIGSHTMSHPMLRTCNNLEYEIDGSKERIEQIIGKPVEYFAYPYGSIWACDRKTIHFVKKAGYKKAFSAIEGNMNSNSTRHPFFLPRVNGDPVVLSNIHGGKKNESSCCSSQIIEAEQSKWAK